MDRAKKLREIYSELRRELDPSISAKDVLRHAAALIDAFEESSIEVHYSNRGGHSGAAFFEWPLDRAFADGGWRVMAYQQETADELEYRERRDRLLHNLIANYRNIANSWTQQNSDLLELLENISPEENQ